MSEKGKIIINKIKKGYEYKVEFVNKKGKNVQMSANGYEFDLSLKDKPCEFEMDYKTNKFIHIWVDGKEIPPKTGLKKSSIKVNNMPENGIPDSLDFSNTQIPKYIEDSKIKSIDNFSLKLNRAARFDADKFKFWRAEKTGKNAVSPFIIKPDFSKMDFNKINKTYKESIYDLHPSSHILNLQFKPEWRMVVGIGNESIYEVSITLHHIYGFPYIPASTIKGVTRNWIIVNKFSRDENGVIDLKRAEMRALKDKNFCDIFGCPEKDLYKDENKDKVNYESYYKESRKGNIIFFDAFPVTSPKIEVDIMNPHYGDYYAGKKPPADYLSPNPIPFLTVTDTQFQFFIAISESLTKSAFIEEKYQPDTEKSKEQKILNEVSNYLQNALTQHGIGAKTAVGYGVMTQ